jgi:CHAT domain-containing protein/tetratricopeptide (TPR) repeat protein
MSESIQQQIARLSQQTVQLYQHAQYGQAIHLARQVCDLVRQYFGESHPEFAGSLNNLAMLYEAVGEYAAAEPVLRQASDILHRTLGENHPGFATSLNNLAMLYQSMGEYMAAEPLYRRAIEIRRMALGENHPDFAGSLSNLGELYRAMGDFVKAERLLLQAIRIFRATLGESHPAFATGLNNLAGLYQTLGDNLAAEQLFRQVVEIRREVLGESHPGFATSLHNLAWQYQAMGNYTAAIPLLQRALEIRRKALGNNHPDVATSANILAVLYFEMGNYDEAIPLLHQALEIRRKALGEKHPLFAESLNFLARLHEKMEDYETAQSFLRQALEINRAALGEAHPNSAGSLNDLALLYIAMGNYAAADPLLRQAMEFDRKVLGENHPDFATGLQNLAGLYKLSGNYTASEPLLQQAVEIRRKVLGENHPDFARILWHLAGLYAVTAREKDAIALMEQAAAIEDRIIGQVCSISSEGQRMAYFMTVQKNFDGFLSFIVRYPYPPAVCSALGLVLRRKAIGIEAGMALRDAVVGGRYPSLEPKLRELTITRMQIAQKTLAGPGPEDLSTHQQLLAEWEARKEKLEAELARQIPEMNLEQKLRDVGRQAVALALSEAAVLVEFVRFNIFDFKAVPARGESQWKPARYLAFVLPAREPDNVQMINLGDAKRIDQMIATFRTAIIKPFTGEDETRGGRGLGALPSEMIGKSAIGDGTTLRAAIFDPLLPAFGNRKRLLLAPDGDLTRLPFEVLPTCDGRRLIDDYQISYLSTGRDVLRFGAAPSGRPAEPLVAADPDFNLSGVETQPHSIGAALRGRPSRDTYINDLDSLAELPGTREEGEHIASMLGVKPWLGKDVLEARIKDCRSPRILHLATHGFFLANQERDPNKELRDLGALGWQSGGSLGRMSGPGMKNPLLRSGLVLAGFKTWLKEEDLPIEAEDGILTAEDVSGLDLLATELVVLSACETGLGEVRRGEGVFGFRRAFVLAGAKTLVMSLWKVPDEQTQELMEEFYRRILTGQPRAEALRKAQLGMKKKYPDPFYWGAFICQGDPSLLQRD